MKTEDKDKGKDRGTVLLSFNCFLLEEIFEKGNISNDQIHRLVRQIKKQYSHLPEGDLYEK